MSKKTLMAVSLLVLAFLVSACGTSGKPSVGEVVAHLQSQQTPFHAVVEVQSKTSKGKTQKDLFSPPVVVEEWVGGPHKIRMEYKDGPDFLKGAIAVSNGDEVWRYDPKANVYFETQMTDIGFSPFSPRLTQGVVGCALKECDFKSLSKDTMAGRKVFKLEAVPKRATEESEFLHPLIQVTFWVDAETWNVLGWELKTSDGKMCMCTKSVEYDPQFPKDVFAFHPPAGASKPDVPEMVQIDPKKADETVGFHVLRPSYLPKDVELLSVGATPASKDQESNIYLEYGIGGLFNFVISETKLPKDVAEESPLPSGAGVEKVKVHGKDASLTLPSDERATGLQWSEGGLMISISGPLKKEAMLKVAESMK